MINEETFPGISDNQILQFHHIQYEQKSEQFRSQEMDAGKYSPFISNFKKQEIAFKPHSAPKILQLNEAEELMLNEISRKKTFKISSQKICPHCQHIIQEQELTSFTNCEHKMCDKCCITYIKNEIQERRKIQCPFKDCIGTLDSQSVILSYLTADELQKLNKLEKQQEQNLLKESTQFFEQPIEVKKIKKPSINLQKSLVVENIKKQSPVKKSLHEQQKEQAVPQNVPENILYSSASLNKQNELGNYDILESKQQKQQPCILLPQKMFDRICTQVWQNKWSNFLKLLPISILMMIIFLLFLVLWSLYISLYFYLIWVNFIPIIWSGYEIWACFSRSIKNPILRDIIFVLCFFCFPLIIIFFYTLVLGIILCDGLYKRDMQQVLEGRIPKLFECRKLFISKKERNSCQCSRNEKCQFCRSKRLILCLVI